MIDLNDADLSLHHIPRPEPATRAEARARLIDIDDAIATIRTQIATADLKRQASRKPIDPDWFHRAKTALRHLERERAELREAHGDAAWTTGPFQGPHHRRRAARLRRHRLGDGDRGRDPGPRRGGALMATLPDTPTPTRDAIYAAYEADRDDGFRAHLGASLIGKSCARALWYDFRWATRAGSRAASCGCSRPGSWRRRASCAISAASAPPCSRSIPRPGGSGASRPMAAISAARSTRWRIGLSRRRRPGTCVEFKTHSAKSFRELVAKGVADAKPQHWAQMQVYMHLTGITRALYVAVCKDTDALHIERVRADADAAERLLAKAARVIHAARPPARISDDPAWWRVPVLRPPCALPRRRRRRSPAAPACTRPPVDGGWHCARHEPPDRRAGRSSAALRPRICSSPIWCPAR